MWLSLLFILILAGVLTYIILDRTVSQMTTVPLWILWAILMIPPLLTGATVTWSKQVPPLPVLIIGCSMCWFLYWRLLDWRRPKSRSIEPGLPPAPMVASQSIDEPVLPTNETDESESTIDEALTAATPRPIEAHEEAMLRTCFAWNVFFLEKIEYRPQAVLCRGKLRTDSDKAYATLLYSISIQPLDW
jgi:hypothetical protein